MNVEIIEEVPGVPRGEQFFIRVNGVDLKPVTRKHSEQVRRNVTFHFPTLDAARDWCWLLGFTYRIEAFRP